MHDYMPERFCRILFMITDNRLDKIAGPAGVFSGYCLMAAGVYVLSFSYTGLILFFTGAFLSLSFTGTLIDGEGGRVKHYLALFGIIKAGKWYDLKKFDRFRIYGSNRTYTTYSRANSQLDISKRDIRLEIAGSDGLKVILKKFNSFEAARNEMKELMESPYLSGFRENNDTHSGNDCTPV